MEKQDQLNQIEADITYSNICPELQEAATQLVMGAGNVDAEIVFIGEAPGKREDEQGKPFVGAAGKFLDEMLASINLSREQIYITNIVKYRPPNNRDPKPTEVTAFLPYLLRQIEVIAPKLLVTLGRFSMNVFLPNATIGHIHGQLQRLSTAPAGERLLLPLYHPAAALYNGGMRQTLLDDFAQIPHILSSTNAINHITK